MLAKRSLRTLSFYELHAQIAALSPNGSHRVIDGASHAGMVFDSTYAEATSAAIEQVLGLLRS